MPIIDDKNNSYEPVNIRQLLSRYYNNNSRNAKKTGFESSFFNPYQALYEVYGNLKVSSRFMNGDIPCEVLRRVSKKAFIINICINHVIKKLKPFLKPSSSVNTRGFVIKKVGENIKDVAEKKDETRKEIEDFLKNTGVKPNPDRDNFQRYCLKIIRDELELDQVATEIGYTRGGKPYAFQAVDAATINQVLPGQENPGKIKYVQTIDNIPQAFYQDKQMIVDYQNPRSDIHHAFYGYSYVDQIIDLVTSSINSFVYNSSFFTENKLPRGMLLVDGNVSQDTVLDMEDYIADIMSGGPSSQWRIPIIPAGGGNSGDTANQIKWVSLSGTSKDMEFQQWMDFQISGIVAMFGCSMDELGLQTSKSQSVIDNSANAQMKASKSTILGDMLSFLQDYLNRIIDIFYPDYCLEFVGYEKENPQELVQLAKSELEAYKTVNEVRKEKGLKPLESKWADAVPANPQLVQMYQSEQSQAMMGGDGGDEFAEDEEDFTEDESFENEEDYGDETLENEETTENEDEPMGDFGEEEPEEESSQENMNKSFLSI